MTERLTIVPPLPEPESRFPTRDEAGPKVYVVQQDSRNGHWRVWRTYPAADCHRFPGLAPLPVGFALTRERADALKSWFETP